MPKGEWLIKDRESGSIISYAATEEEAEAYAERLNTRYQTDAFVTEEFHDKKALA